MDAEWSLELRTAETGGLRFGATKARTGVDGKGTFSFPLPDAFLAGGESARLILDVTVRDRAGQQFVKSGACIVASSIGCLVMSRIRPGA